MPSPGENYQLAQRFETVSAGDMYNVYDFFVSEGSATDTQLLTALSTFVEDCYTNLLANIHATVSVQEGKVNQMLWSTSEWIVTRYVGQILPTLTFTGSGEALPHATSALVQFLTTTPRVVGKKYLPVFTEQMQNGSFIEGGALTNMLAYALDVKTPISAGTALLYYCVRRKQGDITIPYGYQANGTISSQKKRKPGVGV